MGRRRTFLVGLTLAAAVAVPGLVSAALTSMGYRVAGTLAWIVGYGGGVVLVWYVWVRPLDIRGPNGTDHLTGEEWPGRDGSSEDASASRAPADESDGGGGDGERSSER